MAGDYRALRAYVDSRADWAPLDDAAKVAALNAPSDVLLPLTESRLMGSLAKASRNNLVNWSSLPKLMDDIAAQNRTGVGMWAVALCDAGKILDAERDAVLASLVETGKGNGPTPARSIPGWDLPVTIDDLQSEAYAEAKG